MATVSKYIAERIMAGEYSEDGWVKVVRYTNFEGGESYGLVHRHDDPDRYRPSPYVINPITIWELKS